MSSPLKQQSAFSAAKWLTMSGYVGFATGFINSIFITRGLGPESYGVYSYLTWMVSLAVSLTGGGLNITAIRFIAEAVGKNELTEANAIFYGLRRWLWAGFALLAFVLMAISLLPGMFPVEVSRKLHLYLGFTFLCAVLRGMYMFEAAASKGYSIFRTEAITTSLIGIGSTALTCAFYFTHQGLDAYLLLFLFAAMAHPIIAARVMHQSGIRPAKAPLSPQTRTGLLSALRWNTSLTLVGILSAKSMDTYLLGLQSLTVYIGYYNIASSLTKSGLDLLTSGFSSMLLPFISRARAEGGHARVQEIFSASVRFYLFMGILVAGGGYLMAELIVHTLYGKAFDEVIPALQVMAILGGLTMPSASYSAVFIATDNHQARLRFIFLGSGISIATSFAFIPWLGYQGALLSCVVGNTLYVLVVAVVAHRSLDIHFPLRYFVLQLAAALMALGAVVLTWHDPSSAWRAISGTFIFGVLYTVISVNIGAWGEGDLAMLRRNSRVLARVLDVIQLRR